MTAANWFWTILILGVGGSVELWAISTGRYDWTLSKSLRDLCQHWQWFGGVFLGILAWLGWHIVIQKKEKKDDEQR